MNFLSNKSVTNSETNSNNSHLKEIKKTTIIIYKYKNVHLTSRTTRKYFKSFNSSSSFSLIKIKFVKIYFFSDINQIFENPDFL